MAIAPRYMTASNEWFEQVATVPAKFNRAIFYDGSVFHAAQIERPQLLTDDPATGRLTLNGFFRYRRNAG
jgi:Rps23 Pro-64 3,4-dihydroxylase Tpa1-like proline 4-hydroxylase